MRKVRITFRCEDFISGETVDVIRSRWESLPIFSDEALKCQSEVVEVVSVEDAESYDDLSDEWNSADPDVDQDRNEMLNF